MAETVPTAPTVPTTPPKQSPGNRGHYTVYTPEQKAEIGRYAAEHGNLRAVCTKFTEEFGIEVKESTVRQFKKAYFVQLNDVKDPDQITALRGKREADPPEWVCLPIRLPRPLPILPLVMVKRSQHMSRWWGKWPSPLVSL